MKKSILITAYFGNLPYYHSLWERSALMNTSINWLVFTDQKNLENKRNIQYEYIEFEDLNNLIRKKFDKDCSIKNPYKVCDLRPIFPIIFEDYIKGYEYWGHCDLDIVWGDIKKFLSFDSSRVWSSDIISADRRRICGPFTLFKKCKKTKLIFESIPDYKKRLNLEQACILDELEFNPVREKNRSQDTLKVEDFNIFCGHQINNKFIYLQRYSSSRVPAYWSLGKLYVEKYFKEVVAQQNDFCGFGSETMFLHVRPWHYVDVKKSSIHSKEESKEIKKAWTEQQVKIKQAK